MRQKSLFLFSLLLCCFCQAQNKYTLSEDSRGKSNVKYGEHIHARLENSKIFPGTTRDVDVYVPAQYDGKTPTCVCVFQDGMGFRADTVVSNLISSNEIPTMILVAASPGQVIGDFDPDSPRANRTYEYDTPSPRFGKFILEELLPFVESLKTSNGKNIILSKDKNDRMIAGCSSGAACAFNVAWHTDEFARVYSSCGSLTGLRGSFVYATLVHKFETKPIRFYFQSGSNDMWTSFGDWWSANQAIVRAMDFAGYDFAYQFTENAGHCDENTVQVFPDAMRFLWKGYPDNPPAPKKQTGNAMLRQIVSAGKDFEQVCSDVEPNASLFTNEDGDVLVSSDKGTWMLQPNGEKDAHVTDKRILAMGPGNEMLAYEPSKGFAIINKDMHVSKRIRAKMHPYNAVALRDGGYYIVGKKKKENPGSSIWHLSDKSGLSQKDDHLKSVYTIALSANNNWLYAFGYDTKRGFSYKVDKTHKTLLYGQEFFYLHVPELSDGAETTSAICDNFGRTYLATAYGIQVCDYNGRCEAILPLPDNARPLSITWGGKRRNELYVLCQNGRIYKRTLNTQGASLNGHMPTIRVGAG